MDPVYQRGLVIDSQRPISFPGAGTSISKGIGVWFAIPVDIQRWVRSLGSVRWEAIPKMKLFIGPAKLVMRRPPKLAF